MLDSRCATENFHWPNASGRTVALVSTQHLTEMFTRNVSWGYTWPMHKADKIITIMCQLSGNLDPQITGNLRAFSDRFRGLFNIYIFLRRYRKLQHSILFMELLIIQITFMFKGVLTGCCTNSDKKSQCNHWTSDNVGSRIQLHLLRLWPRRWSEDSSTTFLPYLISI